MDGEGEERSLGEGEGAFGCVVECSGAVFYSLANG